MRTLRALLFVAAILLACCLSGFSSKIPVNIEKREPMSDKETADLDGSLFNSRSSHDLYSIEVSATNQGNDSVRVSLQNAFSDNIEIRSFSMDLLNVNASRQRRNVKQQDISQVVGGTFSLQPTKQIASHMTYGVVSSQSSPSSSKQSIELTITIHEETVIEGEISTPDYPLDYPNEADISWSISYPLGYVVRLDILDYSIESCCDNVAIFDGLYGSVLANFTGEFNGNVSSVTSTGPTLLVRFTSDGSIYQRGFKASYSNILAPVFETTPSYQNLTTSPNTTYFEPECNGTQYLFGSNSVISPGYWHPNYYPNNADCLWIIEAYYQNNVVQFQVQYFDIENSYDWVKIYDGYGTNPAQLLTHLTGSIPPYTIVTTSSSRFATMHFYSDYVVTHTGFNILVLSVDNNSPPLTTTGPDNMANSTSSTNCGGNRYTNNGTITSPNYPGNYPNNLDCMWTVDVDPWFCVLFTVTYFRTEACCDYLDIYDETPSNNGSQIAHLAGSMNNAMHVMSDDSTAYMVFHSDFSVTDSGFVVDYLAVDCGNTVGVAKNLGRKQEVDIRENENKKRSDFSGTDAGTMKREERKQT